MLLSQPPTFSRCTGNRKVQVTFYRRFLLAGPARMWEVPADSWACMRHLGASIRERFPLDQVPAGLHPSHLVLGADWWNLRIWNSPKDVYLELTRPKWLSALEWVCCNIRAFKDGPLWFSGAFQTTPGTPEIPKQDEPPVWPPSSSYGALARKLTSSGGSWPFDPKLAMLR